MAPSSSALASVLGRAGHSSGGGYAGPTLLLTLGKGGTGKTTVAGALAVHLARQGLRVVAASIDPAHNLGDVLGAPLGPEPAPVASVPGLEALEVDTDRALDRYLEKLSAEVQHAYRYLQVLNLDGYLDTLRYSPGVEEHSVLEEMGRLLESARAREADVLIVDTPPTGLTLRVLALPGLSVRWAEQLQKVRRALLDRRRAVEHVLGPQSARLGEREVVLVSDETRDPISQILQRYREAMQHLQAALQDPERCGVLMVKNPDPLSTVETARALEQLGAFGIPVALVVVNKAPRGGEPGQAGGAAPAPVFPYPTRYVPLFSPEPIGVEALRRVAGYVV
ncbi:MAG: ArsA family ATPase [Limnochordaceae bacterium]|nr:ArsA family ATPase [Limnochordaceae bacterium]